MKLETIGEVFLTEHHVAWLSQIIVSRDSRAAATGGQMTGPSDPLGFRRARQALRAELKEWNDDVEGYPE